MKVGITGGTGFLGTHACNELTKRGISFELLDKKKHNLLEYNSLKSFVSNKDVIIHLAGLNIASDYDLKKVNISGTENLLKAMVEYGQKDAKIIFSSSFQVYLQKSVYGNSKKAAEELIGQYVEKYDLSAIILRISNMYGPGCKPFYNSVIATFIYQIMHGEKIKVNGLGNQMRDYIYISDVVESIMKSLEYKKDKSVEHLDICTEKLFSLKEVLEILGEITGKKPNVSFDSSFKEDDWNLNKNYLQAKKVLNWEPKVALREGLVMTVKSYEYTD